MITLFKEITTEEALTKIEKEAEKYEGLVCDMDDKEERKFVKDSSKSIEDIRKSLNTARISKTKDYRIQVEAEAKLIDSRLVKANEPFITLIDDHKEKRARILADEKAAIEAEELIIEINRCEEEAINIDKVMIIEARELIAEQEARDRKIADNAAEQARLEEVKRQEDEKTFQKAEKLRVESNKKHVGSVLKEIKEQIMKDAGIDEVTAKKVVNSIRKIERITITY